jgi:hypothetical protein
MYRMKRASLRDLRYNFAATPVQTPNRRGRIRI